MGKRQRDRSAVSDDPIHAGHRHARLEQLIREELIALLRDEMNDPALDGVHVAAVELSIDYRSARVRWFADRDGDTEAAERGLTRAAGWLRARLGEALDARRIPELRFRHDRDAAAAARAARILDEPDAGER